MASVCRISLHVLSVSMRQSVSTSVVIGVCQSVSVSVSIGPVCTERGRGEREIGSQGEGEGGR